MEFGFKRQTASIALAMLKSAFAIFCLFATSAVTVATSKATSAPDGSIGTYNAGIVRQYLVNSDCSGAIPSEAITMTDTAITEPVQRQFIDYGLPADKINFTQVTQVDGLVRSYPRSCNYSSRFVDGSVVHVFNCFESNRYVCQVRFYEQPQGL